MKIEKNFLGDKEFLKSLKKIAIPVGLQNLLASSTNLVDNLMIGRLGDVSVAAVGQANKYFFLASLFCFGVTSGISILTAQYWGKKDVSNIQKALGLNIIATLIVSLPFYIFVQFFSGYAMQIFSNDPSVIKEGASYLAVTAIGYIFVALQYPYSFSLRATGSIRLPIIASISGIITNVFLNWVFIFGTLGVPPMGVFGAGLATLIAHIVNLLIMVLFSYMRKKIQGANLKQLFSLPKAFVNNTVKMIIPVFLNEAFWSLGVIVYPYVYGKMGTTAAAAMNVTNTIGDLSYALFFGLCNATAILIGVTIGKNDTKLAYKMGVWVGRMSWIFGTVMGVLLFAFIPLLLKLYPSLLPETIQMTRYSLYIFTAIVPFRVYNLCMIVGVFRSGGDVKFCMFTDMSGIWLISVPLVLLSGLVFKWPVYIVYGLTYLEEFIKVFVCRWRFVSKRWINKVV